MAIETIPSFDEVLKSGEHPTYKDAVIAHAAMLATQEQVQIPKQPEA